MFIRFARRTISLRHVDHLVERDRRFLLFWLFFLTIGTESVLRCVFVLEEETGFWTQIIRVLYLVVNIWPFIVYQVLVEEEVCWVWKSWWIFHALLEWRLYLFAKLFDNASFEALELLVMRDRVSNLLLMVKLCKGHWTSVVRLILILTDALLELQGSDLRNLGQWLILRGSPRRRSKVFVERLLDFRFL